MLHLKAAEIYLLFQILYFGCTFGVIVEKTDPENEFLRTEDYERFEKNYTVPSSHNKGNASEKSIQTANAEDVSLLCNAEEKPKFFLSSGSLLTYMLRLQYCKVVADKTWFDDECANRVYELTEYHQKVYLKFCNERAFLQVCKGHTSPSLILSKWLKQHDTKTLVTTRSPNDVARSEFGNVQESDHDFNCLAIESYFQLLLQSETDSIKNSTSGIDNSFYNIPYTEWFLTYKPFCHPVACGITKPTYDNHSISAYDCLPTTCRSGIVITMVIDGLLGVIIVISNFIVLAVAARTTIMKNIPGYFKVSLAIGDLLVGLVVLPGCVYHHYVLSLEPLPFRSEGQRPQATDYFKQSYLDFMGIFTVWSFAVSLYTMGAASVDRYLAITNPFEYKQGKYLTKKRSIFVFIGIWLFAFVLALYPVFTPHSYTITALGLVLSTGMIAIFVYAIFLGLPLLAVWVINIAMLGRVCSDKKKRKTLSVSRKKLTLSNSALKEPKMKQVFTVSKLNIPNNQLNDDVFDDDKNTFNKINNNNNNNNNNNKNNKGFFKNNFVYSRGNTQNAIKPQSKFSKLSSSVQSKFRHSSSQSSIKSITSQASVERRLAKTLAVMIGAFTIAILPNIIVLAIQPALTIFISPHSHPKTYSSSAANTYITLEYITSRLFLSNSFWNCIIYSVRNQHFRRAIADVFICDEEKRRRKRNTISNTSSNGSRNRCSQSLTKMSICDNTTES